MQACIILSIVFFLMFAATLGIFILYVKHELKEDAEREAVYKRMKDDYEREKKNLKNLNKKLTLVILMTMTLLLLPCCRTPPKIQAYQMK